MKFISVSKYLALAMRTWGQIKFSLQIHRFISMSKYLALAVKSLGHMKAMKAETGYEDSGEMKFSLQIETCN